MAVASSSATSDEKIYSVSEIATAIKKTLEANFPSIWLEGELSKVTTPASGHIYITLKDEKAVMDATIWKSQAGRVKFKLQAGQKVLIRGRVSAYGPYGRYQMSVEKIEPAGLGLLQIQFEQLKKKLSEKGWFDDTAKKAIPQFPKTVGVITSGSGAAFKDIVNVMKRRNSSVRVVLAPVMVEGSQSAPAIAEAIADFNRYGNVDVLIVGRGGGSPESLWGFNEEVVATAIHKSKVPIISAVGHEIDFTIADFVADLRAPTPSAAAELAVPNVEDLLYTVDSHMARVQACLSSQLRELRARVEHLASHNLLVEPKRFLETPSRLLDEQLQELEQNMGRKLERLQNSATGAERQLQLLRPDRQLEKQKQKLHSLSNQLSMAGKALLKDANQRLLLAADDKRLHAALTTGIADKQKKLAEAAGKLDMLSPLKVLERGYSIARKIDGTLIHHAKDVEIGQEIELLLRNKESIKAKVTTKG